MPVYSVAQTAEATGLNPHTIADYVHGRADLVRGKDFFVRRSRPRRRNIFLTQRGFTRLVHHQYRTIDGPRRKSLKAILDTPRLADLLQRVDGKEAVLRARSLIAYVLLDYLEHPCMVSNCPCMSHRSGLPTAQELIDAGLYGGVQGGKGGRKK